MGKKPACTVVRLARPIEDGSRVVDEVRIMGETGPAQFPLARDGDQVDIDSLAVQRILANRTGLSEVAISRLSGLDFFGLYFALFVNQSQAAKRR